MRARRRDLLLGAVAGGSGLLSGCSRLIARYTGPEMPLETELPATGGDPAVRLLNRIGFGPRPGDVARVAAMGRTAYVEAQLHPDDDEDRGLMVRLRGIDALHSSGMELRDEKDYTILAQLEQAALLSAVYGRHQLRERMADFWTNHFNVYGMKDWAGFFKPADEGGMIRRHALGKFPDLLREMAHSPAMLIYLDNASNVHGVPNENYARELMELHTLGVHGGYSQRDVQELARCLTGWTVEQRFLHRRGTFRFDRDAHDDGTKRVLGVTFPAGGGIHDGDRALDLLVAHPSTARHLSSKLCRYFLGRDDRVWVDRMVRTYRRTGGDVAAMIGPLLASDDLLASPPILKRPFDFAVSALRAVNADTDGGGAVQAQLQAMGEPLYRWPLPDGYPDRAAAWSGSMLGRWNFAADLLSGAIGGTSAPLEALIDAGVGSDEGVHDAVIELTLGHRATDPALSTLRRTLNKARLGAREAAALCIASPAFQWR